MRPASHRALNVAVLMLAGSGFLRAQEIPAAPFLEPEADGSPHIVGAPEWPQHRLVRLKLEGLPVGGTALWDAVSAEAGRYYLGDGQEVDNGRWFIFTGPPGSYAVTATYSVDGALGRARFIATISGQGPQPPPDPEPRPDPRPDPQPEPEPEPGPVVAGPLYVVVIEETADAVAERGLFFGSGPLAALMKAKGHKWRVVDKDVQDASGKPPADVARFLEVARGKAMPQLFLVTQQGQTAYAGDLPKTPADLISLLQKYGG